MQVDFGQTYPRNALAHVLLLMQSLTGRIHHAIDRCHASHLQVLTLSRQGLRQWPVNCSQLNTNIQEIYIKKMPSIVSCRVLNIF